MFLLQGYQVLAITMTRSDRAEARFLLLLFHIPSECQVEYAYKVLDTLIFQSSGLVQKCKTLLNYPGHITRLPLNSLYIGLLG